MTKTGKKAGLPPISYVLLGLIGWFLFPQISAIFAPKADNNPRISYGNHLLIKTNSNTIKESAIAAIDQGYYEEARGLLQKSLAQRPNDPESVIYLSNLQTSPNPFKIAVVQLIPTSLRKYCEESPAHKPRSINREGSTAEN